jgi:hypothetical protein
MTNQYAGRYFEATFDGNSQLIKNGVFSVYTDANATQLATLYTNASKTTVLTSSVTSDANGNLEFFALPGIYYIKYIASGSIEEVSVGEDYRDTADVSDLQAEATARTQGDAATLQTAEAFAVNLTSGLMPLVEKQNYVATSGASSTLPGVTSATTHRVFLTANWTPTFPALTASTTQVVSFTLVLIQDNTGARTVTWPTNVKWPGGTAPTLSTGAGKVDWIGFSSSDGVSWSGFTLGLDVR